MPKAKKTDAKPSKPLVQVRISPEEHQAFVRMCEFYGQTTAHRLRMLIMGELRDGYPTIVAMMGKKTLTSRAIVEGHGRVTGENYSYDVAVLPEEAEGFLPAATRKGAVFALPMCSPLSFTRGRDFVTDEGVWHLHLVAVQDAPVS